MTTSVFENFSFIVTLIAPAYKFAVHERLVEKYWECKKRIFLVHSSTFLLLVQTLLKDWMYFRAADWGAQKLLKRGDFWERLGALSLLNTSWGLFWALFGNSWLWLSSQPCSKIVGVLGWYQRTLKIGYYKAGPWSSTRLSGNTKQYDLLWYWYQQWWLQGQKRK